MLELCWYVVNVVCETDVDDEDEDKAEKDELRDGKSQVCAAVTANGDVALEF